MWLAPSPKCVSWPGKPELVPEADYIPIQLELAGKAAAVEPDAVTLGVGDTLRLLVPVQDPPPEWADGMPSLQDPPSLPDFAAHGSCVCRPISNNASSRARSPPRASSFSRLSVWRTWFS